MKRQKLKLWVSTEVQVTSWNSVKISGPDWIENFELCMCMSLQNILVFNNFLLGLKISVFVWSQNGNMMISNAD